MGEVLADLTPLQRSAVALRVGAVVAVALAGAVALGALAWVLVGGLLLEKTACVPWRVTPAVAPLWRAVAVAPSCVEPWRLRAVRCRRVVRTRRWSDCSDGWPSCAG